MPRDMEQLQLLMALSLYVNSITANPPRLVPATPEMLFGTEYNKAEDFESELEYEYDSEEEVEDSAEAAEASSTPENTSVSWNRISELNDSTESLERYDQALP